MKVVVIGIDALEYDLVKQFRLRNLMQKRYGKIELDEEFCYNGVPYTPIVWTTLITGLPPQKHHVRRIYTYKNPIIEHLSWFPLSKWFRGKRYLLSKLGIKPKRLPSRISYKTIFDECDTVAVNVFGYSIWDDFYTIMQLMSESRFNDAIRHAADYSMRVFKSFAKEAASKDFSLAMMYTNILDIAGHLCWHKCFSRLTTYYKLVDRWVGDLLELVPHDAVIIVSDHGMGPSGDGVTGNHTKHMFWSTSNGHEFASIYDIPRQVVRWCKSGVEEVKEDD